MLLLFFLLFLGFFVVLVAFLQKFILVGLALFNKKPKLFWRLSLAAHKHSAGTHMPPAWFFDTTRILLGCTQRSAAHSLCFQAPELGRGKSKPAWRLPSSLAHLKSGSQQGCVVPSLRLLLAALCSPNGGMGPP